jgi:hypothetical protein
MPGLNQDGSYTYYKYPFPETLHYANVSIFELGYGEECLEKFDRNKMKYCSPVKRERENTGYIYLKKEMNYIIIPATESPGLLGDFYLSIYAECELRDIQCKRVHHPLEKPPKDEE